MKKFSPLFFLAALGAGGIAVMPFAFLQYTFPHGKGLIKFSEINLNLLPIWQSSLFMFLLAVMITFTILHFILSYIAFKELIKFKKSSDYHELNNNISNNASLAAPLISVAMTFNVFIGAIRFFIPWLNTNFQALMLPALIAWLILWIIVLKFESKNFQNILLGKIDINKINFSWLLHVFALAMTSVVGAGIAALAASKIIAGIAAFMTFISLSFAFVLLIINLSLAWRNILNNNLKIDESTAPSALSIVPILTLFSISGFRLIHFLDNKLNYHLNWLADLLIVSTFLTQIWFIVMATLAFRSHLKGHISKKEYLVNQWGLICPVVGLAVLGSFAYASMLSLSIIYFGLIILMVSAVLIYTRLFYKLIKSL